MKKALTRGEWYGRRSVDGKIVKLSEKTAKEIIDLPAGRASAGDFLAVWWSPPEYVKPPFNDPNESLWRITHGWLRAVWDWAQGRLISGPLSFDTVVRTENKKKGKKKTVSKKRAVAKKKTVSKKRRVYYRLPAVLVELGKALELGLDSGKSIKFKGGFMLASNVDGDRLFVLPIIKKASAGAKGDKSIIAKARKLYRRFTDFESSKSYKVKLTDHILKKLGNAVFIAYRSDKWSGKNVDYIHHFENRCECWADDENEKDAQIFAMRGSIAVKKEGITG